MTTTQLNRIKKKLPPHYAVIIAKSLGTPTIDNRKVIRVMNGEVTDPDFTTPILDAALQLIEKNKKLKSKLQKTLKAA